jgi:hypothetical protein
MVMDERPADSVPTYGLLVINHAYNEGKITFKEWLELSRQWAEAMLQQHGQTKAKKEVA